MRRLLKRQWKAVAAVVAVLTAGLMVYGQQGQGDPFHDQSDTGETIHVLPGQAAVHSPHDTQPSFAAPQSGASVFPASYGKGNLSYHGGNVMSAPQYYAIYWNSAVANSQATSMGYATIQNQIAAFIGTFFTGTSYTGSTVDDYSIVGQYGDAGGRSPVPTGGGLAGQLLDTRSAQATIKDSAIQSYITGLLQGGKLPVDGSGVYGVYFPSGMRISLQGGSSCSSFCGYHSHFSFNGTPIKYAVFPYPDCSGCKLSSMSVADMLTIVSSHEIREAVTDPGESNKGAWYDQSGYESDDKCAWHNLYQLNRSAGLSFWVQPEYSNGGGGYPGPGCVKP